MTKFRIVRREHFTGKDTVARYLVVQRKEIYWPFWLNITYFYESEIEDMPGVWTHVCTDVAAAHMCLNQYKKGVNAADTLVYEE